MQVANGIKGRTEVEPDDDEQDHRYHDDTERSAS